MQDLENDDTHEIIINWPDCDILPATKAYKNKLKSASFQQFSVRLLRQGSWEQLMTKKVSKLKHNMFTPKKEDRKLLKRKILDSNFTADASNKARKRINVKNKTVQSSTDRSQSHLLKEIEFQTNYENVYHGESDCDSYYENPAEGETIATQFEPLQDNLEKESLNKETSQLENDAENDSLRAEIFQLQEELDKKKATIMQQQDEIVKLKDEIGRCANNSNNAQLVLAKDDLIKILNIVSARIKVLQSGSVLRVLSPNLNCNKVPHQGKPVMLSSASVISKVDKNIKKNAVEQKIHRKMSLYPTTFKLTQGHLKNIKDNADVKEFVNMIIEVLFTEEELANSSLTGRVYNASPDVQPKPGLDPERLNAARNYCLKKYRSQKNCLSQFHSAIRSKLQYFRKIYNKQQVLHNVPLDNEHSDKKSELSEEEI